MRASEWQYLLNGRYYMGVERYAEQEDVSLETVRRRLRAGKIAGAIQHSGMWMIPMFKAQDEPKAKGKRKS